MLIRIICKFQDIAERMLDVINAYSGDPRARVDACERLARALRVLKPLAAAYVKPPANRAPGDDVRELLGDSEPQAEASSALEGLEGLSAEVSAGFGACCRLLGRIQDPIVGPGLRTPDCIILTRVGRGGTSPNVSAVYQDELKLLGRVASGFT